MPTIIRADTDQLRAVARQMRTTADEIMSGANAMHQAMGALDATWSGSARDRGMARWGELVPKYPPAVERLVHFANELEALAQRLDDAAAVFGTGDYWHEGSPNVEAAPQTMADLFDRLGPDSKDKYVKDGHKGGEIEIYQVGPNEYAVLLQGTEPEDLTGINSLEEAAKNGLGNDTRYKQQLEQMLAKLPPGANVHLVGYSLGGIVAQNVAADQTFLSQHGLNVQTVTTFGSPKPLVKNPNVDYSREYDAPGDTVSLLRPPIQVNDNNQVIINPESAMALMSFLVAPVPTLAVAAYGIKVHTSDYKSDSTSETRQKMAGDTNLPFKTDKWVPCDVYKDDGVSVSRVVGTIATPVTNTLSDVGKAAVDGYNGVTKTVGEATSNVVEGGGRVVGEVKEAVVEHLPEPVKGFFNGLLR